ncbi:MAG: hypothetical protein QNJ31_09145 [Candidatus Caenarcaniphilales bacterium]|nr:hypothetical protein [Candidatus Caenarcaniphilales bacterium]
MFSQLIFFLISLIISFGFFQPSQPLVQEIDSSYSVYKPEWSVKKNNGDLKLNSLAPYELIDESQKSKKIPLVLVHGVVSEFKPYSNWDFLLKEIEKSQNKDFLENHSIYIFRYQTTNDSWDQSIKSLRVGIQELLSDYPKDTQIKIVVSSLGGPIVCDAIGNNEVLSGRVSRSVSLSSPFWGTPLLNRNLSVNGYSKLGPINELLFDSTHVLFPSLDSHIAWKLPLNDSDESKELYQNYCKFLKPKMINYSGFISSPYNKAHPKQASGKQWFIEESKDADYKKIWNLTMHYKICSEMTRQLDGELYLFSYNDGLVPIYSALWIDPHKNRFIDEKFINEDILREIKDLNPKARLFKGINHSEFTDTDPQNPNKYVVDLLHPMEKKTIAAFIIEDLKN